MKNPEHQRRRKGAFIMALIGIGLWVLAITISIYGYLYHEKVELAGFMLIGSGILGIIGLVKNIQTRMGAKNWKYWVSLAANGINSLIIPTIVVENIRDFLKLF